MASENSLLIPTDQLDIGMFVRLELSWFSHSFSKNSFKIVNAQQIKEIQALKIDHIRIIVDKTEPEIVAKLNGTLQKSTQKEEPNTVIDANVVMVYDDIAEAKKERFEKLVKQREEIARHEQKFVNASTVIKDIDKNIFSRPKETVAEASKLIDSIAQVFSESDDAFMLLIRYQQAGGEDVYFHTLNVAFVAMMLANELKCNSEQLKIIGLAALFHDLGKVNVPANILKKTMPLSRPERAILELHTYHGEQIGRKANLDKGVLSVIANHHEFMDGTGYPNRLKGEHLNRLTRIITIANEYDNLCNHVNINLSLTPHEALALMFSSRRSQFDPVILATLVKCLGIYPPGTIVRLSDGSIGLVVNVNTGKSLRPQILVYDPDLRPEDMIILDLANESDELRITEGIRPAMLPTEILHYLNPRKRLSYFMDSKAKSRKSSSESR